MSIYWMSVVKAWALLLDTGNFTGVVPHNQSAYLCAVSVSFPSVVPQWLGLLLKHSSLQPGALRKTNLFFWSQQQQPFNSCPEAAELSLQQRGDSSRKGRRATAVGENPYSCPKINSPHSRRGPLTDCIFWFSCHRTMEAELQRC